MTGEVLVIMMLEAEDQASPTGEGEIMIGPRKLAILAKIIVQNRLIVLGLGHHDALRGVIPLRTRNARKASEYREAIN